MGTMRQSLSILTFDTRGTGLLAIGDEVEAWIDQTGINTGVATLFCQHTSASLIITENASAAVPRDLLRWLARAVPEGFDYEHDDEGPDDMPAHIKAMLTGSSLVVPVAHGRPALGTWQGLYLIEHRRAPHRRRIVVQITGE